MSAKKRTRIQNKGANKGGRFHAEEPPDYNSRPPVFSLERLQTGDYCLSKLDKNHKAAFAEAIFKRKNLAWREIARSGRHSLGTEKIPKHQIKAAIPPFITEDQDHFLVFRYHGTCPMVGFRKHDVFYVLWFDHDFSLYDH
ncbi:hypothetical protein [Saccharospirillum salsuginis]|uniref:hypothetical protein n=1 Tax=Saccharospirillum salsuginis TaxID=418750 RepID=UPI001E4446B9|nr:hypothetical protein [Saccharospirillum salsuginis]